MLGRAKIEATEACPLCGADGSPMFEVAGHMYWRCAGCTLVFASGHANANFRESIEDYEPAYRRYLEDDFVDASNLDDLIEWIESYVSLRSPEIRLLDVGSGSGKLIRRLSQVRHCTLSGIEPSVGLFKAYDLASHGIEAITLRELAARDPIAYDVVTVLDVIEHAPDAGDFVHALARVTRPGSFVFLTTPNVGGPLARLLGRHWHHYNAYHFSLYGTQAIAEAARRNGFRVVSAAYRSKRVSLSYLLNRVMDPQLGGRRKYGNRFLSRLAIPLNFGDVLSVVWQRT